MRIHFIVIDFTTQDETWTQPWGENKTIRNHYNEMAVHLSDAAVTKLILRFRVFDDGVGFRYEYEVSGADSLLITDELTEFNIAQDGTSWSIPANYDTYELLYRTQPVSRIDNVNTPMTFIYADGKEADWITNPTAYEIIEKQVTAEDTLSVDMARGGRQAITFMPL